MANQDNRADHGQKDAPPRQINGPSRRRLLYLLGAGGAVGLAGCSGGNDGGGGTATDTGPTATGTTTTTETGDTEKELHKSATIGVPQWIGRSYTEGHNLALGFFVRVTEPLTWNSLHFRAKPWLAKDWERTGDTTWEFTLRENVTFHNGDSLTAERVISSLNEMLENFSWFSSLTKIKPDGVKKVDDMTLELTTIHPTGNLPGWLTVPPIFHPETSARKEGNSITDVAGTGPYMIEELKFGKHAKSSAYDDYWGGNPESAGPHMEKLTFRAFSDRNTRALALAGQRVDVAKKLPPAQFESVKNAKDTKVAIRTKPGISHLGFNLYEKPTSDLKFRKAINFAVSQTKHVEGPQNGLAVPARGMLAPFIWLSAHDSLPTYGPDKAKAKQLLDQSSYNGGTLELLGKKEGLPSANLVASTIKQQLKDIGVDVEVQLVGGSVYDNRTKEGEFHMRAATNSTTQATIISSFLREFVTDDKLPGAITGHKYTTDIGHNQPEVQKRYDSLIIKAIKSSSDEKTKDLAIEAQHVLMEDALPLVPLFHPKNYTGMRSDVEPINWHTTRQHTRYENLKYFK